MSRIPNMKKGIEVKTRVTGRSERSAPGVQGLALGHRQQSLGERPKFLGLGQGGLDLLAIEQRGGHVS